MLMRLYFYPRPPGGGRLYVAAFIAEKSDFYPRPPGGGRPENREKRSQRYYISIHALRVEGDCSCMAVRRSWQNFYPRPPGGGRRAALYPAVDIEQISIHALRVEGDPDRAGDHGRKNHFYPRPPGGGRPDEYLPIFVKGLEFLSTPSGWRATYGVEALRVMRNGISIHALRVEGDAKSKKK